MLAIVKNRHLNAMNTAGEIRYMNMQHGKRMVGKLKGKKWAKIL